MTYIDNLLISFPSETSNECIQDVWLEVENCITDGSVLQGGVADMDKNELQVLYEWARVSVIVCLVTCSVNTTKLLELLMPTIKQHIFDDE